MLAVFNIGPMELLIIALIGLFFVGVAAAVIMLVIVLTRNRDKPRND